MPASMKPGRTKSNPLGQCGECPHPLVRGAAQGLEPKYEDGSSLADATSAFDAFDETETETAIVSKYVADEDRWEIIMEK